jgi:DNA-binding SARP family transcriptional activator
MPGRILSARRTSDDEGARLAHGLSAVPAASARPPTQLRLLGGFELLHGGAPVGVPAAARRLLAFVALRDRAVTRTQAAGVLWDESSEEHAAGNIRTLLWSLRKVDAPTVTAADGLLRVDPALSVDITAMTTTAKLILDDPDQLPLLDIEMFADDLLPDWYDDWLAPERERLRQLRLHALEALCCRYTSTGRIHQAIQAGLSAVEAEPLRESANHALISAYIAEGNRVEAIRHFRAFSDLLGEELGLRPTRALHELVEAAG